MTLYELDKAIADFELIVNEDGEVLNIDELDELNLAREQKIESISLWIKNLEAEKEAVKHEKDNFADREKKLGKIGEQIQVESPLFTYDDLYSEYGGRMRLNYLNGIGGWQDVLTILIAHGYEVTAHTEVASEVEREVDGIDKWIVIEFDEVE